MSAEEQDAIQLRLLREVKEGRKQIAFLEAKLGAMVEDLRSTAHTIEFGCSIPAIPLGLPDKLVPFDVLDARNCMRELDALREQVSMKQKNLDALG